MPRNNNKTTKLSKKSPIQRSKDLGTTTASKIVKYYKINKVLTELRKSIHLDETSYIEERTYKSGKKAYFQIEDLSAYEKTLSQNSPVNTNYYTSARLRKQFALFLINKSGLYKKESICLK